ncbi:sporulation histidine kinase inhibitor Sda [Bacillus sp. FJAT-50079]|nr:sporulation histidine kinase inhibitor Sda [Bacillus sp. FJAT-50079]MBS4209886.1 sporulation histidine kinase inhibitor Sda [Bacillus sp. FJAT-50079]
MRAMSNERLVAAYRDAKKNNHGEDWIRLLKIEIKKRGLKL